MPVWYKFRLGSIAKKLLMAVTGGFMLVFLLVHLAGNWQLLNHDGGRAFNLYANFMGHNPVVQTVAKFNFAIILLHAGLALRLWWQNRMARGKTKYYYQNTATTAWVSRNMGVLGSLILMFLGFHLYYFWMPSHFERLPLVNYGEIRVNNLYGLVTACYSQTWQVALYLACLSALGLHLWHGAASIVQTFGIHHGRYYVVLVLLAKAVAFALPALFAYIPVSIYLKAVFS